MKQKLIAFGHRLKHHFGWYHGEVITWWIGDKLMVGFKCDECGQVSGVDVVPDHIVYPERH